MSYRFIDANELISEVDFKTQDIINNMDCVYVDGIKTCNQHFNLEEHDAEIRADERRKIKNMAHCSFGGDCWKHGRENCENCVDYVIIAYEIED